MGIPGSLSACLVIAVQAPQTIQPYVAEPHAAPVELIAVAVLVCRLPFGSYVMARHELVSGTEAVRGRKEKAADRATAFALTGPEMPRNKAVIAIRKIKIRLADHEVDLLTDSAMNCLSPPQSSLLLRISLSRSSPQLSKEKMFQCGT